MQKHPMKLGLLCASLIFSSCGRLPVKPSIDLCAHDAPEMKVYCVNNQTNEDYVLDISETDRYIMMSSNHWGLTLRYIRILEQRIRSSKQKNSTFVANEVRKVITVGESLL
jgi:hypothetical protein